MKAQELREMSDGEVREKIAGWEEELFNLRFQAKLGQLGNPLRLRLVRREIARARTVMQERAREAAQTAK